MNRISARGTLPGCMWPSLTPREYRLFGHALMRLSLDGDVPPIPLCHRGHSPVALGSVPFIPPGWHVSTAPSGLLEVSWQAHHPNAGGAPIKKNRSSPSPRMTLRRRAPIGPARPRRRSRACLGGEGSDRVPGRTRLASIDRECHPCTGPLRMDQEAHVPMLCSMTWRVWLHGNLR